MADVAPTQEFPPWLIPIVVTTTINGVPTVQTSISEAPLTYFGPSIPLGNGWVFGGSTFPPSINFVPTSTSSASPSSSSTTPSPTPSASSSSSSTPSPSPSSTSSQSLPTQPTSNPISAASRRGLPLVGKILIPILIVVVVTALVLLVYFCYWRRRRRRSPALSSGSGVSSWEHIEFPGGPTTTGGAADLERAERDAFLGDGNDPEMSEVPSISSTGRVSGLIPVPWRRDSQQRRSPRALTNTSSSGNSNRPAAETKNSTPSSSDPEEIRRRFNASHSTVATSSLFFNPARRSGGGVGPDESGVLRRSSEDPGALLSDEPPRGANSHEEVDVPPSNNRDAEERTTLLTAQQPYVDAPKHIEAVPTSPSTKKSTNSLPPTNDPHDYYLEGYMADEKRSRPESLPTSPSGWLTHGIMAPLRRFSWFKRMEAVAGPSGTRRSSPSSHSRSQNSPRMSRIASAANLSFRPSVSRPHSGLLHPGFGSRPTSGYSFLGVDPSGELGLRPPGMRISGTGSTSAASGGTVYHTASSKATGSSGSDKSTGHKSGVGEQMQTMRAVDALDSPIPETTLPSRTPVTAVPQASRTTSLSSKATGPSFPPGLINVQMWDKSSTSDSNKSPGDETLEDEPPRAQGDWSSLRSHVSGEEREPRVRALSGEQHSVEILQHEGRLVSEIGSIGSEEREIDMSSQSPRNFGFSLTPRVSMHAISANSGSHSSRPSHHTAQSQHTQYSSNQSHSQDPSADSEDNPMFQWNPPTRVNRVSLSAVGGDRGAIRAPQLPPIELMDDLSMDSPIVERSSEEFERTTVASGSMVSPRAPMSETGTSVSTGAATTVLGAHHEEKE